MWKKFVFAMVVTLALACSKSNDRRKSGWSDDLINSQIQSCESPFYGRGNPSTTCSCYVNTYSERYTPTEVQSGQFSADLNAIFMNCDR